MPFDAPSGLLNSLSVRAFNEAITGRAAAARRESYVNWDSYFYPLDALLNWNRIYGRNGFAQFQCVLPLESSARGMRALLEMISNAGAGSFLAVLKRFGAQESRFSFPMLGYTLALDFPVNARMLTLMDRLDRIVLEHGGRFYLAKDSRMSAATLAASDPRAQAFRDLRQSQSLTGASARRNPKGSPCDQGPVLIIGAASDIGRATAHAFAAKGHAIQLAARNSARLAADQTDIAVRYGVSVTLHDCDALATESHAGFVDSLPELPQIAVCVVGVLGDQAQNERDIQAAVAVMRANYEGPASLLAVLANRFEKRGTGTWSAFLRRRHSRARQQTMSMAPPRPASPPSSPACVTARQEGRPCRHRVAGLRQHADDGRHGPAGKADGRAAGSGRSHRPRRRQGPQHHLCPPIWQIIMLIIRHIPEAVFKKLSL